MENETLFCFIDLYERLSPTQRVEIVGGNEIVVFEGMAEDVPIRFAYSPVISMRSSIDRTLPVENQSCLTIYV